MAPASPPPLWLAFLLLLAAASSPTAASAQARPSPFETLDLSLSLLSDVSHGTLHDYWSAGPAVAAAVALPFYVGSVEMGLQYAHPEGLDGEVPGFRSLLIYTGWGGGHGLGSRLRIEGGIRFGVLVMRFDGDTIPAFQRSGRRRRGPDHLAMYPPRHLVYRGVRDLPVQLLTQPRMEQVFVSAGLGRRFGTPRWLRDFVD